MSYHWYFDHEMNWGFLCDILFCAAAYQRNVWTSLPFNHPEMTRNCSSNEVPRTSPVWTHVSETPWRSTHSNRSKDFLGRLEGVPVLFYSIPSTSTPPFLCFFSECFTDTHHIYLSKLFLKKSLKRVFWISNDFETYHPETQSQNVWLDAILAIF